jgi:hypothetical protein
MFRFKTDRKRSTRKLRSQDAVPFAGVWIGKRVVKNHRYLRDHGFNHSPSVANVDIDQKLRACPPGGTSSASHSWPWQWASSNGAT